MLKAQFLMGGWVLFKMRTLDYSPKEIHRGIPPHLTDVAGLRVLHPDPRRKLAISIGFMNFDRANGGLQ
jgi:hypothetical protein